MGAVEGFFEVKGKRKNGVLIVDLKDVTSTLQIEKDNGGGFIG